MEFRPQLLTEPTEGPLADILPGIGEHLHCCPACQTPYYAIFDEFQDRFPRRMLIQCRTCRLGYGYRDSPCTAQQVVTILARLRSMADVQFNRRCAEGVSLEAAMSIHRRAIYDADDRVVVVDSLTPMGIPYYLTGQFAGEYRLRTIPAQSLAEALLLLPFEWQTPTDTGWRQGLMTVPGITNLAPYRLP